MTDCEAITDVCTDHGEGVIWDAAAGAVRWVDMLAGDILTMVPSDARVSRFHVGMVAASIRPRRVGGLVIALERGFALLDAGASRPAYLGDIWDDPTVRMNDGGCDPQGRFYCGSMAYNAARSRGALYRLDPDGTVSMVLGGVTISNGLAWSPDGATVYYVDSATQRIDAFDFDPIKGGFEARRALVQIPIEDGTPDGLTVDAEGFVWVAMWRGGSVRRYAPDGRPDGRIELPAWQITACAFGGASLDELYVTSSRQGLAERQDPYAGVLFRCSTGVKGLPSSAFAG